MFNETLTRLEGKQSNQDDNVKMLKDYLRTNSELDDSNISSFQLDDSNISSFLFVYDINEYHKDVNVDHANQMLELTRLLWPGNDRMAVSDALSNFYKDVDVDHVKRLLDLTRLFYPDDESMAVGMAMNNDYKDVDVDQAKRMLRLTNILFPDYIRLAVNEAMKLKYKAVDFKKVDDKYKALKNSKSWYDYWYSTSDRDYMKRALELTYPEIVKEDF
jgi:hypothetical protein